MKKFLYTMSVVAAAFVFQSCGDNPNTVNPTSQLGTSTIKGTVYANVDETKSGLEKAANAIITARVYTAQLAMTTADQPYAFKYYKDTTDANGNYSFAIEVGNKNVDVVLLPHQYEANIKFKNALNNDTTRTEVLTKSSMNVQVFRDATFVQDFILN